MKQYWGRKVMRLRRKVGYWFRPEDVRTALGIIYHESRGTRKAVNPESGAAGYFQHLPKYWEARSLAAGFGGKRIFDADANIGTAAWLVYDGWHPETAPNWQHWAATYPKALADIDDAKHYSMEQKAFRKGVSMLKYDYYTAARRAVAAGVAAFAALFPAGFTLSNLGAAKLAVVAGVGAGFAALIGGALDLARQVWRDFRGFTVPIEEQIVEARRLLDEALRALNE